MPAGSRCTSCGAATPGPFLCTDCLVALRIELTDAAGLLPEGNGKGSHLPSLGHEVDTTRTRQDQLAPAYQRWVASRTDAPIPVKMHAAEAARALSSVLVYWAGQLGYCPVSVTSAARCLLSGLDAVARHHQAGALAIEVTAAIHRARHAIDRPHDTRLYLGPCDEPSCRHDVYAAPAATTATCARCGATYEIDARRAWLLDAAQDRLGTAVEVAGLLRAAGVNCSSSRLRGYAHRGTLPAVTHNEAGHPMYRVRDALAEVVRTETARQNDRHDPSTSTARGRARRAAHADREPRPTQRA